MPSWVPLITADAFTGPRADVMVCITGLLGIGIIIFAVSMIMRGIGIGR